MARVGFVGVLSIVVLGLILGLERSEGTVHSVGDSTGWGAPTNSDFYDDWADRQVFRVGDQLSFSWTGTQNVAEVTEQQHDDCIKVTAGVMTTSPAVYNLTAVGRRYFISTIGNQCNMGQELEIDILPAVAPTTPPRTTSPPPSTGTPTPVPTPTPASRGTVHVVGDAMGWGLPANSDFYDDWEERQIFRVGDQLVFNWNGTENVVEVTEQQHDDCIKVPGSVMTTSPVVFNLTATGKRYFISTTGNNCNMGQELEIEIHPALASPTTPSPPATTMPAPPRSTVTPAPHLSTTHTVGDATGWTLPTHSDFYDDWADRQVFMVGDKLSFNWTGTENVVEVNENQHDDCIKVTSDVKTTSPAVYELTTIGKRYFISTIGNNCNRGQELEIEVLAAPPSTATPSTPMTSPPSGSPMGPSGSPMGPSGSPMGPSSPTGGSIPSGSSTSGPSPPPPNASASFGPMVVLSAALSTLVFAFLG